MSVFALLQNSGQWSCRVRTSCSLLGVVVQQTYLLCTVHQVVHYLLILFLLIKETYLVTGVYDKCFHQEEVGCWINLIGARNVAAMNWDMFLLFFLLWMCEKKTEITGMILKYGIILSQSCMWLWFHRVLAFSFHLLPLMWVMLSPLHLHTGHDVLCFCQTLNWFYIMGWMTLVFDMS